MLFMEIVMVLHTIFFNQNDKKTIFLNVSNLFVSAVAIIGPGDFSAWSQCFIFLKDVTDSHPL